LRESRGNSSGSAGIGFAIRPDGYFVRFACRQAASERPEVSSMKARMSVAAFVVPALAASLLLGSPATALSQDRRDIRLADDVVRALHGYPRITIFDDVNIAVESGIVTLTGKVTMPYKRDDIGRRVSSVDGVRELQNRIEVLPVSPHDDDLRYRIARAIYGNPSFWNYAAMANPPIHIIVERGRVTLTGVVNSNVERMLARSLATGWGELSVTNELRTDAEIKIN
jgi:hyperosmotically inducible protein